MQSRTPASRRSGGPFRSGQGGMTLLYVIIFITVISAVTAAVLKISSSQLHTEITHNNRNRAVYLAEAGVNFVRNQLSQDVAPSAMRGNTYSLNDQGSFTVESITGDEDDGYSIQILGTANAGETWEANYRISNARYFVEAEEEDDGPDITFDADMEDFADPVTSRAGAFVSNVSDQLLELGGSLDYSWGAVYYTGDKFNENAGNINSVGGCEDGACNFYRGFRLFYVMEGRTQGDGWTFVVMNAANNTTTSVGGWEPLGELMGYAGNSMADDGTCLDDAWLEDGTHRQCWGITSPKFALEYDTYGNDCYDLCRGTNAYSRSVGSRCDPGSGHEDQLQFIFWGDDNVNDLQTNNYSQCVPDRHASMDDNRHDRGYRSGTPVNYGWGGDDYIVGKSDLEGRLTTTWGGEVNDWFNKGQWAIRMEVFRDDGLTAGGNYQITLRTWVRYCGQYEEYSYWWYGRRYTGYTWVADTAVAGDPESGCASVYGTAYENTRQAYNPSNHRVGDVSYSIEQTFELTPDQMDDFGKFYFGWTQATGAATQSAYIRGFQLSFIRDYYLGLDQYCSDNSDAQGCTVDDDPDWPDDPL